MRILRMLFGIVFSVAGVLHFKDEEQFRRIVPAYLPFRKAAVLITGVMEIVFGVILLMNLYGAQTNSNCWSTTSEMGFIRTYSIAICDDEINQKIITY